jgi:CRISPR-associated protein Csb1
MNKELTLDNLISQDGPTCLVIKATLEPVGEQDRFQPAGFPEVGHVLYDAPRRKTEKEKVCIIDSAASMANHLEAVCMAGPNDTELHPDLAGLPYVICKTDREFDGSGSVIRLKENTAHDRTVFTSLTEGHRLASDYFLDAFFGQPQWNEGASTGSDKDFWKGTTFRERLKKEFEVIELKPADDSQAGGKKNAKKKGKAKPVYFIAPESQWKVYQAIFRYDPNSLIHGIFFAKEQIKLSRLLTASLEAFGASRVPSSGVKFDRLGKTLSGQPIFAVDEETAREIRATFIIDLALLRSYGRNNKGLDDNQKRLLIGLTFWKLKRLLDQPFRYRSGCYLKCVSVQISPEGTATAHSGWQSLPSDFEMAELIEACQFGDNSVTEVYYPANKLFKLGKGKDAEEASDEEADEADDLEESED